MADNRDNPSNKIRRVSASSKNGQSSSRTNASKVQRSSSRGNSSGGRSSQSINTNVRRSSDSSRPNPSRRSPGGQNRNIKKSLIFLKKSLHSSFFCDSIFFVDSAWFSKATVNKCRNGGIGRRVRFRSV